MNLVIPLLLALLAVIFFPLACIVPGILYKTRDRKLTHEKEMITLQEQVNQNSHLRYMEMIRAENPPSELELQARADNAAAQRAIAETAKLETERVLHREMSRYRSSQEGTGR